MDASGSGFIEKIASKKTCWSYDQMAKKSLGYVLRGTLKQYLRFFNTDNYW